MVIRFQQTTFLLRQQYWGLSPPAKDFGLSALSLNSLSALSLELCALISFELSALSFQLKFALSSFIALRAL
jgi:hypothetical protein